VSQLRISGYQAVDWLREHRHVNLALADHRRVSIALTRADSHDTTEPLLAALGALSKSACDLPRPSRSCCPLLVSWS
jgi:arginine decarboxylase